MSRIGVREALLAAFLVASGAPLLVFWLWPHSAALQNEVDEVRERHLLIARNLGAALDRYHADLTLTFASVAPLIARGEPVEFARDMLRALNFRHVCVAEPHTGRVVRTFLTEAAPCPERVPAPRLAMFREMTADGAVRVSPLMRPPDDGPPRLFVAARAEGLVVVAAIGVAYFGELAGRISFGRRGHAAIVDARGCVLAHPRADWVAEGRDLSPLEPVRRIKAGETGVATFWSPAMGEEMIAGFTVALGSGWGVMVPQPLSELQEAADEIGERAALVFLAGLSLSAAIALAFSAHVSRSVRRVAAAALRMAEGEAGVRLDDRDLRWALADFARLGRSFNAMARRVDDARERVSRAARSDPLTGLLNRGAFVEAARAALDGAAPGDRFLLFFIDMDRFKAINDGYGHAIGDALLRRIARRLRRASPPGALVARQSGDEFLLLHRRAAGEPCIGLGPRLLATLAEPVAIGRRRFVVSASIGVSVWPRDARDLGELVSHADQAMLEAKRAGRDTLRVFDSAIRRRMEESEALKRALQTALAEGDLEAAFQPVLDARTGRLAAFEALARWSRPEEGAVPPERFVPLAEEAGLIAELGRQVRRRAFAFAAALARRGARVPVAVNVSPVELAHHGFAAEIDAALDEAGLAPGDVILEITESLIHLRDGQGLDSLDALRARGFGLALDDFGKGFSSHVRLRRYPFDRLKIDLGFAGDATADRQARAVVKSLIKLGRSLGMTVTVEGVETAAQQALATRFGADEVQGFWHHRPLGAEAALALAVREGPPASAVAG